MEYNYKRLEERLEAIIEFLRIEKTDSSMNKPKYYRNKDLKNLFGLSPNTIIKYRQEGILPYTIMGEVYLYPVSKVENVLQKNASY